jgi:hypothetical protein
MAVLDLWVTASVDISLISIGNIVRRLVRTDCEYIGEGTTHWSHVGLAHIALVQVRC